MIFLKKKTVPKKVTINNYLTFDFLIRNMLKEKNTMIF